MKSWFALLHYRLKIVEGVERKNKRLRLNPAAEDHVNAHCIICHAGQEAGRLITCWTCNMTVHEHCARKLVVQDMKLSTQQIGQVMYRDMLHPHLYSGEDDNSAEKNQEVRQYAGHR